MRSLLELVLFRRALTESEAATESEKSKFLGWNEIHLIPTEEIIHCQITESFT